MPWGQETKTQNGSSACMLGCVRLFVRPWTVAHQAPPSRGLSRQEYWNGLPCPPAGDLPYPGIEPACVSYTADRFFTTMPLGKPPTHIQSRLQKWSTSKQKPTTTTKTKQGQTLTIIDGKFPPKQSPRVHKKIRDTG